jgi:hypothetical protein
MSIIAATITAQDTSQIINGRGFRVTESLSSDMPQQ